MDEERKESHEETDQGTTPQHIPSCRWFPEAPSRMVAAWTDAFLNILALQGPFKSSFRARS
jgi:hypothetical protein